MKKQIIKSILAATVVATSFSACNKDPENAPKPDEQELITTLKINIKDDSGFDKTFVYKVENGFGSGTAGTIQIDTVKLSAAKTYTASLTVLNEKKTPADDITTEVIEENEEHLFFISSNLASGAGSVLIRNGSKDNIGKPFNQTFQILSGANGNGKLQITLLHLPTNKDATSLESAGGETDLDAIFPVLIN